MYSQRLYSPRHTLEAMDRSPSQMSYESLIYDSRDIGIAKADLSSVAISYHLVHFSQAFFIDLAMPCHLHRSVKVESFDDTRKWKKKKSYTINQCRNRDTLLPIPISSGKPFERSSSAILELNCSCLHSIFEICNQRPLLLE